MLFYIFLSYPSASSPMRHDPPSWTLSRAGRLSATRPRLGFGPPPNNSCPGHHLPPHLGPPYPDASALRSACRVVDHRYVWLVNFCQDMMQEGRAKPAYLSSISYVREFPFEGKVRDFLQAHYSPPVDNSCCSVCCQTAPHS
jgi:hypothetical protein